MTSVKMNKLKFPADFSWSKEGHYHCRNEGQPFVGRPYSFPIRKNDDGNYVLYPATFCCPGCAKSFMLRYKDSTPAQFTLFTELYGLVCANPDPSVLSIFGSGFMSLEAYRASYLKRQLSVLAGLDHIPFPSVTGVNDMTTEEEVLVNHTVQLGEHVETSKYKIPEIFGGEARLLQPATKRNRSSDDADADVDDEPKSKRIKNEE